MNKKRVSLYAAGGIILLVFVVYFAFFRGSKSKYDFRFDKVAQGDLSVYVTATGTINPVTTVDVGTQVSGIVVRLNADYNSVVHKGQVIAQIDTTFLVQAVKDADASLERAKAQYDDSKRTLDRTKALLDRKLAAQADYDAALTQYETNAASLKSAQSAVDKARINLAYATIYAPIDGVVINRAVNIGQTVAASFSSPTLYTIANDMRKMQVQTTVDETDIGRISIDQEASFTVDAYPDQKFTGKVSQIRLSPTTISNVVNYIVIIDVNNDDLKLMPGMTANVKILVGASQNALKVLNMALRFQPPAELIDSTKVQHFGGSGHGHNRWATNAESGTTESASPTTYDPPSEQGNGQSMFASGNREQFRAIRDSIQKAHGGEMSREEVRAEMQKVFAKMGQASARTKKAQPIETRTRTATTFGITQTFPEYEKSAYEPDHQSGFGRIWILEASGKLEPVYVRTGLNDGKYTEISAPTIKAGDQIVLSANELDDNNTQGRSPLTGQGQMRFGGGGFR